MQCWNTDTSDNSPFRRHLRIMWFIWHPSLINNVVSKTTITGLYIHPINRVYQRFMHAVIRYSKNHIIFIEIFSIWFVRIASVCSIIVIHVDGNGCPPHTSCNRRLWYDTSLRITTECLRLWLHIQRQGPIILPNICFATSLLHTIGIGLKILAPSQQ